MSKKTKHACPKCGAEHFAKTEVCALCLAAVRKTKTVV